MAERIKEIFPNKWVNEREFEEKFATQVRQDCQSWYFGGQKPNQGFELDSQEGVVYHIYRAQGVSFNIRIRSQLLRLPRFLQNIPIFSPVVVDSRTLEADLLFPVYRVNQLEELKQTRS